MVSEKTLYNSIDKQIISAKNIDLPNVKAAIRLISKLSDPVTHGNKKARQSEKELAKNQFNKYYFNIEKCKGCLHKDGYYKEGSKTYSVTIKTLTHQEQMDFQETE